MYVTFSPAFSYYSHAHIGKVYVMNCFLNIMECNLLCTIFVFFFKCFFMIRTRVCDLYKDFVNWVDIHNHSLLGLPVKLRLCCAAGWNVTLLAFFYKKYLLGCIISNKSV